ncbi:COMPASS component SWD3, partial [Lecanoromycetidae sp. Uapishka_2]
MDVTQYVKGINAQTNDVLASFDTPADICEDPSPSPPTKRDGTCSRTPIKGKEALFEGSKTEVALNKFASSVPDDVLDVTSTDVLPSKALPADATGTDVKVSVVRNAGTLTRFASVGKAVIAELGVAATVAGALFVILDFVDHNWVGGAIGAVGLAAGIAAGFALSGPIGWIVGGAIAALFAILPSLFQGSNPPADRTDIQGIIQWKLFGNKDHTGNEQCQQGTADVPGNPNCQALYGAGTLSLAMGMNNFDAIVFLTQFNQGYAMSIKDMAAAYYVVDETKPGDGSDKIATITCNNNKGIPAGKAGIVGGDPSTVCDNPTFAINRPLITLPVIGATADKVFNRIIQGNTGDCKLVAHPGDAVFQDYNITINGLPSAVACGLTASIQVEGTTVDVGSTPAQSTDGQGGAYVAPPAAAPFKSLDPTGYVCLAHDSDPPFCLPPGSYQTQSGLGFEIGKVDGLTLPPGGWSLATHWEDAPAYRSPRPQGFTDNTYSDTQDPTKKSSQLTSFQNDMSQIAVNRDGKASFTIKGPNDGPDPVCCLFSEPQFGGNVWCVGVGGGPTLPQWSDIPQSVSCHGGGNVWLYADTYGDTGGALVQGNVEDLSNEPYGPNKGTFSKNVKALWVLKGHSPDELAPSSDRERYHGRRPTSQAKRGSKSRKKSKPKIAKETSPDLSQLAAAPPVNEASEDELTSPTAAAEFAAAADEGNSGKQTPAPSIDAFEQFPDTTLPQSFNEMPRVPSDPLRTPPSAEDADQLPDKNPPPFVEDSDEDRPNDAISPLTQPEDDEMPDAANAFSAENQADNVPDEAAATLERTERDLPNHTAMPAWGSDNVERLPDDFEMPTFLRRSSTFKKTQRQPHDRSTSRSPPPFSTISIPAATPPEPLIGPPQRAVDSKLLIWDTATGNHLHTLEGHLAGISTIAWSPDSKTLASGSDDKSIRLWDVSTGKTHPHPLQAHSSYVYSLSFSPRGNMLASGSYDEALFLWDVRTSRLMRSHPAHSDPIGGVDFVRDGTLIVSCAGDGLIRVWDTATGQCLRTLVHEDNAPVTGVCFSPNGKFVLAWTLDSSIRLWNYVEGRCVKTYQGHKNEKYSIGGAFGVYDNKEKTEQRSFAVSGSEDGSLFCWDVQSKEILQRMEAHDGVVMGVDTWPDGGLMVSGGIDKTVRIWERDEGVKEDSDKVEDEEEAVDGIKDEEEMNGGKEIVNGVVADHNMVIDDERIIVNGELANTHANTDAAEQQDLDMGNGDTL